MGQTCCPAQFSHKDQLEVHHVVLKEEYEDDDYNQQLQKINVSKLLNGQEDLQLSGQIEDFKDDEVGIRAYSNGDKYEGNWLGGKKNGKGTMTWADQRKYTGYWFEDKMYGVGKMEYPDGSIYEGRFNDNLRSGHGIFKSADGDIFEGQWEDDRRNGEGTIYYGDGSIRRGYWENNLLIKEF